MDLKDIKTRAKKVASINAQKRRLTRKENKEIKKINEVFLKIQNEFSAFIFGFDWDNITHLEYNDGTEVSIEDLKPFKDFNTKWIKWCLDWERDKKHNTQVDKNAFHDWAINNEKLNKDDKPIDFIDIKQSYLHGPIFRVAI